eukprot:2153410-Amphidinium_carterae.1
MAGLVSCISYGSKPHSVHTTKCLSTLDGQAPGSDECLESQQPGARNHATTETYQAPVVQNQGEFGQ